MCSSPEQELGVTGQSEVDGVFPQPATGSQVVVYVVSRPLEHDAVRSRQALRLSSPVGSQASPARLQAGVYVTRVVPSQVGAAAVHVEMEDPKLHPRRSSQVGE